LLGARRDTLGIEPIRHLNLSSTTATDSFSVDNPKSSSLYGIVDLEALQRIIERAGVLLQSDTVFGLITPTKVAFDSFTSLSTRFHFPYALELSNTDIEEISIGYVASSSAISASSVRLSTQVGDMEYVDVAMTLSEISTQLSDAMDAREFLAAPLSLNLDPRTLGNDICHKDVLKKFGTNSTKVTFTLRHIVPYDFSTRTLNASFWVVCNVGDIKRTKTVDCLNGHTYSIFCNGSRSLHQVDCPKQDYFSTCRLPGEDGMESSSSKACHVTSFDALSTTCECDLCDLYSEEGNRLNAQRRLMSPFNRENAGNVRVVPLADYVYTDFVDATQAFREIKTAQDLTDSGLVSIYMISCIFVFCGILFFVHAYHSASLWFASYSTNRKLEEGSSPSSGPGTRVKSGKTTRDKASARFHMATFIGSIFPGSLSSNKNSLKLEREMKNAKTWGMVSENISFGERATHTLQTFTTFVLSGFLMSMFLDIQYPSDDGICDTYVTEDECLRETSIFRRSETKCIWTQGKGIDGGAGYDIFDDCSWQKPEYHPLTLMSVVLVVVAISAPLYGFFDIVFTQILRAPTVSHVRDNEAKLESLASFLIGVGNVAGHSFVALKKRLSLSSSPSVEPQKSDEENVRRLSHGISSLKSQPSFMDRRHGRKKGLIGMKSSTTSIAAEVADDDTHRFDKSESSGMSSVLFNDNLILQTMATPLEFSHESRMVVVSALESSRMTQVVEMKLDAALRFRIRREEKRKLIDLKLTRASSTLIINRSVEKVLMTGNDPGKRRMIPRISVAPQQEQKNESDESSGVKNSYRLRRNNIIKLISSFSVLDVDLTPIAQYVDLSDQNEVDEVFTLLSHLEGELIVHRDALIEKSKVTAPQNNTCFSQSEECVEMRKGITPLMQFDAQWGIGALSGSADGSNDDARARRIELEKNLRTFILCRDRSFIAHKFGAAFRTAKSTVAKLRSNEGRIDTTAPIDISGEGEVLFNCERGIRILRLYVEDMLGAGTPQAGTFRRKHGYEFGNRFALTTELKVLCFCIILLLDLFLVVTTINQGRDKGITWQRTWLWVTLLKVTFDIAVKEMIQNAVIHYGIPNLLNDDIQLIRRAMYRCGSKLLKKNPAFHLNRFSATDYLFASTFVAREFPDLLESKLVLMYRDVVPERVSQLRFKRQSNNFLSAHAPGHFYQGGLVRVILLSFSSLALQFGSLSIGVQRLVLDMVPAGLLVFVVRVVSYLSTNLSLIAILFLFLLFTFSHTVFEWSREMYSNCFGRVMYLTGFRSFYFSTSKLREIQKEMRAKGKTDTSRDEGLSGQEKSTGPNHVDGIVDTGSSSDSLYSDEISEVGIDSSEENDEFVEQANTFLEIHRVTNEQNELRRRSMDRRELQQRTRLRKRLMTKSLKMSGELVAESDDSGESHTIDFREIGAKTREVLQANAADSHSRDLEIEKERVIQKKRLQNRLAYRRMFYASSSSSSDDGDGGSRQGTVALRPVEACPSTENGPHTSSKCDPNERKSNLPSRTRKNMVQDFDSSTTDFVPKQVVLSQFVDEVDDAEDTTTTRVRKVKRQTPRKLRNGAFTKVKTKQHK